mmetsp:Transcript_43729/g.69944  ORF Transcript_43729/g.69944 Transcript_43729/m.69944 type:complete len:677 (-) Transcript_43729:2407-4437(-)|eukprot:CAMPEP_0203759094 /NCGR_PEP_ID=MMETSP0098-20131031/12026_1 /ASSEMBLY_ACC=CAM_ASM_000208 /TAXON_ID=96639 /ORGANISM=" , Strain NY0313808BC1" /LENGTH=676 /DNA_ID=CAMNT_0050651843 /DNA_START=269 /DNA_END=2299 /DNA_ORIENTATION=-
MELPRLFDMWSGRTASRKEQQDIVKLSVERVEEYLLEFHPSIVTDILGGQICSVVERTDGNINHVFQVCGKNNISVCLKQALPSMSRFPEFQVCQDRVHFENASLLLFQHFCAGSVPLVYGFDEVNSCIVMEYLYPHKVLRHMLVQRIDINDQVWTKLGYDLGSIHFSSSVFGMDSSERRRLLGYFSGNNNLCQVTEEAVLTSPFVSKGEPHFPNRWTSPELDVIVREIHTDDALLRNVAKLKAKFLNEGQCLIHGDLHTGSLFVENETNDIRMFDTEFTFWGPMGFDIGLLIANLVVAGIANSRGDVAILSLKELRPIRIFWDSYVSTFQRKWREAKSVFHRSNGNRREGRSSFLNDDEKCCNDTLLGVWSDALGYAGCEIVRRIVGVAHVEDLESINDREERSRCERKALEIGKILLKGHEQMKDWEGFESKLVGTKNWLFLVAKFPRAGKSKTRLAKTIGIEAASQFSRLCIMELVEKMSKTELDMHRVILFSPNSDREEYMKWLAQALPGVHSSWQFQALDDFEGDNLGGFLNGAFNLARENGASTVSFIGMDVPDLTVEQIEESVNIVSGAHRAYISPANDGGYVLLTLPINGQIEIGCFEGVHWSTPAAFATQVRALNCVGLDVTIGEKVWSDVDDIESLREFKQNNKDNLGRFEHFFQHADIDSAERSA